MAAPKLRYKFAFLDRGNGVIVLRHVEFASDELAVAHAQSLRHSFGEHAIAITEGERVVCRVDSHGVKLG